MVWVKKTAVFLIAAFVILLSINSSMAVQDNASKGGVLSKEQTKKIDDIVKKQMKWGKVPGMSVVVISEGKEAYKKSFGYADRANKKVVTGDTLFELGSVSKSFTALGLMKLKEKAMLNIDDNINKYIAWFKTYYKGKKVDLTLRNLLYQDSVIKPKTLDIIKPSSGKTALEDSVRLISGCELGFYPGSRYEYSTVNYDILGLVIEKVSGQPFEEFMKKNVLEPMGLNHTYVGRIDAPEKDMAKGYKYGFLRTTEYKAPVYRGNTPGAYMISCINDMERLLKFQMGLLKSEALSPAIFEETHIPNRTVMPSGIESSYAMGWHVLQIGAGEYIHGGSNPTYFSYVNFRPNEKTGVAVLSNINSYATQNVGSQIMDVLLDRFVPEMKTDTLKDIDTTASAILFLLIPLLAAAWFAIGKSVIDLFKGNRKFRGFELKSLVVLLAGVTFLAGFAYCIYKFPQVINSYKGFSWDYLIAWGPFSLIPAVVLLFAAVASLAVYLLVTHLFLKENEKPFFFVGAVGLATGFGNAIIIFIINLAIANYRAFDFTTGTFKFQSTLFLYLLIVAAIYIIGQKLISTKMAYTIGNYIYNIRRDLINQVLNSSYYQLEALGRNKIQTCLNNDAESVSRLGYVVILNITSLVTLICCFVYLGFMNLVGLFLSIGVILMAMLIYFLVARHATIVLNQARDTMNLFFKFIDDITNGFKELYLHKDKQKEFREDMLECCDTYRKKRINVEVNFANAVIIGELLFTIVIGTAAFFFPIFFPRINANTLGNFVFVFLYMTGPVNAVLKTIPEITQVRVSLGRINEFKKQLSQITLQSENGGLKTAIQASSIRLRDVMFSYKGNSEDESFTVGPLNCEFHKGEITFITGGNGSGKSTMAKLISGLYPVKSGEILLDGQPADMSQLKESFSAVFSDVYLFQKLYGVDAEKKKGLIGKYLSLLGIDNKVKVENNHFSTIDLSSGQKKRLALLVSYLEDRPFYLFDEWAADQDPEFRRFFYLNLLPEMKKAGKCIIAITHDDRYFNTADKIISMDYGKIGQEEAAAAVDSAVLVRTEKRE